MHARIVLPLLLLLVASGATAQDPPGLGFAFRPTADGLLVQAIASDGPARSVDLRPEDLVTAVAGKNMVGLAPAAIDAWFTTVNSGGIPVVLNVSRASGDVQVQITPAPYSRDALRADVEATASAPAPPQDPKCISGDCRNGRGTWRYDSGATYEGLWRDSKRHGRGTFTFANGQTFVGDWVEGSRIRGRETYESGNTYDGDYTGDKRHGQGTMTYASGSVYNGAWADGKRNGQGAITYSDGNRYEGLWRDGKRHGQGTFTWTGTGMTFVGDWADGRRARGREMFTDGRVYEGEYADGKRHGQGTMTYADGRVETGLWREGAFVESRGPVASSPGACARSVPILTAVSAEQVRCALAAGENPNAKNRDGLTPLSLAASGNRTDALRLLVSAGANLEAPIGDQSGMTVLLLSLKQPAVTDATLRALLDLGANPNARDAIGTSPLFLAILYKRSGAVRLLLEAGADPAESFSSGKTLLDLALEQDQTPAMQEIVAALRAAVAAPEAPGDVCVSGNCQNGTGTKRYASGQTFTGTFRDGQAVSGQLTLATGDTYAGDFAPDGRFHGKGLYTFGPGDYEGHTFEGTFLEGAPSFGTYTWPDGQTYTGAWNGWARTGQGTMIYANGNRYEGLWREGERHGTGTFIFTNGGSFTGDWVDGERVRGRETYASGNVYEGAYASDTRHGVGTMTYASGSTYTGDWAEGKRAGQGTFTWADGKVYTGDWADDKRHGQGVMTWPDGQRHEGAYKADKRSGDGTMTYADGRVFVGTFDESVPVSGTLQRSGGTPRPVRNENGTFVYTDQ